MELLDVTLREGQQRPGAAYSVDAKVAAARALDELGVDAVQVGFPVADDGTAAVCERLTGAVDADLTGIARAVPSDVAAAVEAGVDAVEVFAPTSERQRTRLLGCSVDELEARAVAAVDVARDAGLAVTFAAMDGFRTEPATLDRLHDALAVEGFGVADTVGARTPHGVVATIEALAADPARLAVHFHDDLGLATANALAAARTGVGRVDVAVAGIGERAGNTPLEEFAVAAELAAAPGGSADGGELVGRERDLVTSIDCAALVPGCRAVLAALDESVPPAKPLLGAAAFAHESGLHTAAMLDEPATFEAFDPGRFGAERRLLFGPQSGRGAARRLLERAGVAGGDDAVAALVAALGDLDEPVALPAALDLAREVAGSA